MTIIEHLLVILNEEAVEVAQRADKALRFGLHEQQPEQDFSNATRIMFEFSDLVAMFEMLQSLGIDMMASQKRIRDKKEKVINFLHYSEACGTLPKGETEKYYGRK